MSRDNQIEEMAKVIQNTYLPINQGNVTVGETRLYSRDAHRLAENLYNAGYRNSTDLAEEIFSEIEKMLLDNHIGHYKTTIDTWCYNFNNEIISEIAELKKKYTERSENGKS